jgi:hypothetical protein
MKKDEGEQTKESFMSVQGIYPTHLTQKVRVSLKRYSIE